MTFSDIKLPFQKRWIYALIHCLLIAALSYCYDIGPSLKEIKLLTIDARNLSVQLKHAVVINQLDQKNGMPENHYSTSQFMTEMLRLIQQSGLTIKSLNLNLPTSSISETNLHLVLQGGFQQFIVFISAVAEKNHVMFLTNFSSMLTNENKLIFVLDIFPLLNADNPYSASRKNEFVFTTIHNPFCVSNHSAEMSWRTMTVQNTSIAAIKMLGYFQYGKTTQALLRLPNDRLISLGIGSMIGKERGRILEVKPNHLLIILPNKKLMTLKRESYEINSH